MVFLGLPGLEFVSSETSEQTGKRFFLFVIISTVIMTLPALINGSPFLYFDSNAYLSRPEKVLKLLMEIFDGAGTAGEGDASNARETNVIGGRSIVYGFFAWFAYVLGRLWPLVIFQAVLTSAVLGILTLTVLRWKVWIALGMVVLLSFSTPLAFFAGLAMPDFLAPLTILSIAILALFADRLSAGAIGFLVVVLLFAMLSHTSHFALAAVIFVSLLVAKLLHRNHTDVAFSRSGLSWIGLMLVITFGFAQLERAVASRFVGAELLDRPHLTAHLVDNGPGFDWVRTHCDAATPEPFAICAFRDRLPVEWRDFLFVRAPENGVFVATDIEVATQRALSVEDFTFARAVLRDAPGETLSFAFREMIEQLRLIGIESIPLDADRVSEQQGWVPPDLGPSLERSLIYNDVRPLAWLSRTSEITAFTSLVVVAGLGALSVFGAKSTPPSVYYWLALLILFGVVLNAAICGIAASPYPRFQARIVFLLPLTACILIGCPRSFSLADRASSRL